MIEDKRGNAMTLHELDELLTMMGWSKTRLAAELDITGNAVDKWYGNRSIPGGPTSILLKDWLYRARRGEPLRAEPCPAAHRTRTNGKPAMAS